MWRIIITGFMATSEQLEVAGQLGTLNCYDRIWYSVLNVLL